LPTEPSKLSNIRYTIENYEDNDDDNYVDDNDDADDNDDDFIQIVLLLTWQGVLY